MLDTLFTQIREIGLIDWIGMATGIIGVWLSIKERISAWFFFIACYLCYIWIGISFGLYAFAVMNLAFAGIAIYGLIQWRGGQTENAPELKISEFPKAIWPKIIAVVLFGTVAIGLVRSSLGEANILPYLDTFAACCGFAAQWMLSRKYLQNWPVWIVSDLIYLYIFIKAGSWPTVILFAALTALAIKGWHQWHRKLDD